MRPHRAAVVLSVACAACRPPPPVRPIVAPATGARAPLEYGRRALEGALAAAGIAASAAVETVDEPGAAAAVSAATVALDRRPESFVVLPAGAGATIVGSDAVGAMYGALDLAERVNLEGRRALPLAAPIVQAPAVPLRGAQLYVTVPGPGEISWWFRDPAFWQEYLDLLARARFDFLDLRGMYDPATGRFPDALPYFATSATLPEVGLPPGERDANLAALRAVVTLAAERGIRVGFMIFEAYPGVAGGAHLSGDALATYTREAIADLVARVPGLWRVGFRIGESGRSASWYEGTFLAPLRAAATTGLYTRSWLVREADLVRLAADAGPDTLVLAKYNGEQLGPPYVIEGGAMATRWPEYSYGGLLPPHGFELAFEVRTAGTHRAFREASYARARRAAATFTLGGSRGFVLEAGHAYAPQRDEAHVDPGDVYSPWTFRSDELEYLLYGRLAYDPTTPEVIFRAALASRTGRDALWDAVQAASDIVPWVQTAHTCGPDQRDFAPDLEWGGPIDYWIAPADTPPPPHSCNKTRWHGPFDGFSVASPADVADDLVAGRPTSRLSPVEVARRVLADAEAAEAVQGREATSNAEARDVVRECFALADLGEYFGHKLRAAAALAVYRRSAAADYLAAARDELDAADAAWRRLAADTVYLRGVDDVMRVGRGYHWRDELPLLAEDRAGLDRIAAEVAADPPRLHRSLPPARDWLAAVRADPPRLQSIDLSPVPDGASGRVATARFAGPLSPGCQVRLLWKPLENDLDWSVVPASGAGSAYTSFLSGASGTLLLAVDVIDGARAWRLPDPTAGTPYVVSPP